MKTLQKYPSSNTPKYHKCTRVIIHQSSFTWNVQASMNNSYKATIVGQRLQSTQSVCSLPRSINCFKPVCFLFYFTQCKDNLEDGERHTRPLASAYRGCTLVFDYMMALPMVVKGTPNLPGKVVAISKPFIKWLLNNMKIITVTQSHQFISDDVVIPHDVLCQSHHTKEEVPF